MKKITLLALAVFFLLRSSYDEAWAQVLDPSDFLYRQQIWMTNYTRAETLVDIPLLVTYDTNQSGFYTGMSSPQDAGDLRFTAADGTNLLHHEVDFWNTNGDSHIWVEVPALTTGVLIWAYWGGVDRTTPAYALDGSVWDNGYRAVWHMTESDGNPRDSARNPGDHQGVNAGTAGAAVDARVGQGYDFSGTGLINISNVGELANLNQVTVSYWYYKRSPGGGNHGSVLGGAGYSDGFRHLNTDSVHMRLQGNAAVNSGDLADDAWHHLGFSFNNPLNTARAWLN
ncbi:MAG: hypothetical protein AAF492_09160, partial [Verrucomicrobiota bacterium]